MLLLTELEVHTRKYLPEQHIPYGSKSRLIRALLYTYPNKTVQDETLESQSVVYCVSALPGPYAGPYAYVRTSLGQSDQRIRSVFRSVYNNVPYSVRIIQSQNIISLDECDLS